MSKNREQDSKTANAGATGVVVEENRPPLPGLRQTIFDVIFGHQTAAGLTFDLFLLAAILCSVVVVCLETVSEFGNFQRSFLYAEIGFTLLFAAEYLCRIWCVRRASRYALSFFGIVDLLSVLPSLIGLGMFTLGWFPVDVIVSGTGSYAVIRSLRLLRVFRLLRIGKLEKESMELAQAVWNARSKVVVFLSAVMITVIIAGTLMYEIEGLQEGSEFKSIPQGIYWAIVTMTTVGYGDIVPRTVAGQLVSSLLILIGYSLIIVPTGFVSAEVIRSRSSDLVCRCGRKSHESGAQYCLECGSRLDNRSTGSRP